MGHVGARGSPSAWLRLRWGLGGGAISLLETTVLLTVDESLDALRMAEQVQYRALCVLARPRPSLSVCG